MKRFLRPVAVVGLAATLAFEPGTAAAQAAPEQVQIQFPVQGATRYTDDFGAPRSGGRFHEGNDILWTKLQRVVATTFGLVTYTRADSGGLSGNMLVITDDAGWAYRYMHLNNDTPGTDDGLNPPNWIFAPGITVGLRVAPGQHVGYSATAAMPRARHPMFTSRSVAPTAVP